MNRTDAVWAVGRLTIGSAVKLLAPLRVYGAERVPLDGGLVVAANHFSWVDPPALGAAIPRTLYFMAKVEAHRVPGLGELMRSFGTFSVRRGESDRDAVRTMREIVRDGRALGLFVEGTRQRSGVLGPVQPGAAMVAITEDVPVICARSTARTSGGSATSTRSRWRGASRCASTGCLAEARATRRRRSRSGASSGRTGSGSRASTHSAGRATRRHRDERGRGRRDRRARWRSSAFPTSASRRSSTG